MQMWYSRSDMLISCRSSVPVAEQGTQRHHQLCASVCVRACVHASVRACLHTWKRGSMHVCMHMCTREYMYAPAHVRACACVRACVRACVPGATVTVLVREVDPVLHVREQIAHAVQIETCCKGKKRPIQSQMAYSLLLMNHGIWPMVYSKWHMAYGKCHLVYRICPLAYGI